MRHGGALLLAAAMLALCTGATSGCATTPVTPAAGNQSAADTEAPVGARVSIGASGFSPRDVTIQAGESVVWENGDAEKHNVGGSGLVSGPLGKGATYTHRFEDPGVYQYICTFHPDTDEGMVTVQAK